VVIPAAGRGTRLGIDVPKLFAPLSGEETVWTVLRRRSLAVADHLHVVVSPRSRAFLESVAREDIRAGIVSFSVQREPSGMGDAVFTGSDRWAASDHLVVVWGDQVGVTESTLATVVATLSTTRGPAFVLPIVDRAQPYVEYVFDAAGRLGRVLESREGDRCSDRGQSDVGVFGLTVTGLLEAWATYLHGDPRGAATREINFLPFLAFLSSMGWATVRIELGDAEEARGINTPGDLAHFQRLFEAAERMERS
jgi:bifunctional UDP-N-acetylglucosamine pyrophosphorylase/glucosamine-1-phosphate N-acetyltransferase